MPSDIRLRDHLLSIWQSGVDAVRSEVLVRRSLSWDGSTLSIQGSSWTIPATGQIVVVGGGKAGAGMATAIEELFSAEVRTHRLSGWVNVPADCVKPLERIVLHPGRPKSLNEPTQSGIDGTLEILERVRRLKQNDLCLVLISGGGSALTPAPVPGITLADKQAVTRFLSAAGATIQELNTVRKQLSLFKGGGLARACHAGTTIALIISDVVGDPLDIIASGPTVDDPQTPQAALDVLTRYHAQPPQVPESIFTTLREKVRLPAINPASMKPVQNFVIGSNRVAMDAAARRARELGYEILDFGSNNQGEANAEGIKLVRECERRLSQFDANSMPLCILSGGEPVVRLKSNLGVGKGGRNQQLVLSALSVTQPETANRFCLLSGGTDGEDGPTDAAGAILDADVLAQANAIGLDARDYLDRNDAYHFFELCGGLIKTGPTHTNVMDLRVAIVRPDNT